MDSSRSDDFPDSRRTSGVPANTRHSRGVLPTVAILAAASIAAADASPGVASLTAQQSAKAATQAPPPPSGQVRPSPVADTVESPTPLGPRMPPAASGPVTHPDDDFLGSTITANEGAPPSPPAPPPPSGDTLQGLDVSNYQGSVDWGAVVAAGGSFAYIKATEGTGFVDQRFGGNSAGAADAGVVRGAYHFALPDRSSGATQANFFVDHGGGWVADGITLPPVIDMEYNPYGPTCYGLSKGQMAGWVADFSDTVHNRTGRWPVIYTTTNWWSTCTGDNGSLGDDPLWIARYSSTPGALPAGWDFFTFWQYADAGVFPGDQDIFSGGLDELHFFASNAAPLVLRNPELVLPPPEAASAGPPPPSALAGDPPPPPQDAPPPPPPPAAPPAAPPAPPATPPAPPATPPTSESAPPTTSTAPPPTDSAPPTTSTSPAPTGEGVAPSSSSSPPSTDTSTGSSSASTGTTTSSTAPTTSPAGWQHPA